MLVRSLLTRGRVLLTLLAVAALSLGTAVASAQAATATGPDSRAASVQHVAVVTPDFTCPERSVCLFPNDDWTGNYAGGPVVLPTDVYNGAWRTFDSVGASSPHPGSLNDKSNSVMWIYAADVGQYMCLTPDKWILFHSWGWFFIQFGVTSCPAHHPAGP